MTKEEAWLAGVQAAMAVNARHFTAIKDHASKETLDALRDLQRKLSDLYCAGSQSDILSEAKR